MIYHIKIQYKIPVIDTNTVREFLHETHYVQNTEIKWNKNTLLQTYNNFIGVTGMFWIVATRKWQLENADLLMVDGDLEKTGSAPLMQMDRLEKEW